MALQGNYNFKGLSVEDCYVKITNVNYSVYEEQTTQLKTPAVLNEDGSIKTPEVMETINKAYPEARWTAVVWKDKASRDAVGSWNNGIITVHGTFVLDTKATAKNPIIQAYNAMKAEDAWKDYTDV
tara:strand:+ start:68 stop:445 length:378 start_codon:yes stop_codon:yes gene_type:complete